MKDAKNFFSLAGLFSILISSCAITENINETMQSWVGHHQSELIQSWGPPTRTTDDGAGGRILIYETYVKTGTTPGQYNYENNSLVVPGSDGNLYHTSPGTVTYDPPQQQGYTRSRMFYANSEGKIYYWRWQGM